MKRRPKLRKLAVFAATGAVLIAATAMSVSAHPRHRGPGMGAGPFGGRFEGRAFEMRDHFFAALDRLDLSNAQKERLREIRRRAPSMLMPKRQAMMEARMDLQDLFAKKDADPEQLREAHDRLMRARNDLQAAAFDLRLQAREVLSPAQREKLRHDLPRGGERNRSRDRDRDRDQDRDGSWQF